MAAGKVDLAEFARVGRVGAGREMGGCADFMMFFDATARPERALGARDGAEMNSRVQLPIRFSDLVMERTQKRGGRNAQKC